MHDDCRAIMFISGENHSSFFIHCSLRPLQRHSYNFQLQVQSASQHPNWHRPYLERLKIKSSAAVRIEPANFRPKFNYNDRRAVLEFNLEIIQQLLWLVKKMCTRSWLVSIEMIWIYLTIFRKFRKL